MRVIYSVTMSVLTPLFLLRLWWRGRRAPAYRARIAERLGFYAGPGLAPNANPIWVHAVSLGETLAARPLLERLLATYPDHPLVVTTSTPTGSEQVERLFGDRVYHVYAPWDSPAAVKRFLRHARPALLLLMETELWPNMLHHSNRQGCRVILANARLAARSAAGYARIARTSRGMLACLDQVVAQGATDADRFVQLGMNPARVRVAGSIKFDVSLDEPLREQAGSLRKALGDNRHIIVFASTHHGEDQLALDLYTALRKRYPELLMVLAPRHPERFDDVAELCEEQPWRLQRRSATADLRPDTDVLLLDTLGELLLFYGLGDLAIVGGSFVPRGGHNPLEATVWGVPVLAGPHMFNFADVAERLAKAGALLRCNDLPALLANADALLADPDRRAALSAAATQAMKENQGAIGAQMEETERLLGGAKR